jgi:hypothetical protein
LRSLDFVSLAKRLVQEVTEEREDYRESEEFNRFNPHVSVNPKKKT